MLRLVAAILCACILAARADNIVITVVDQDTGGVPVTILSGANISALDVLLPSGQAGGNFHALTSVSGDGSVYREFAVDDYYNDLGSDTVTLYATFSGITGPSGSIILPTIQQVFEYQPGWVVSTEISVNNSLLDLQTFTALGTRFGSVYATVGSPFSITEAIQFVNNNGAPAGDIGAAVLAQPDARPSPVPGPVVGAGLPGLILGALTLLGLARRRRVEA
jgi:hypothetical protein